MICWWDPICPGIQNVYIFKRLKRLLIKISLSSKFSIYNSMVITDDFVVQENGFYIEFLSES